MGPEGGVVGKLEVAEGREAFRAGPMPSASPAWGLQEAVEDPGAPQHTFLPAVGGLREA